MCVRMCVMSGIGVGWLLQGMRQAFRGVQRWMTYRGRYDTNPCNLPCSGSISIQSCYSLPNIQLILFPHLPARCTSYHSSPCTILRVHKKKKETGLYRWACWSYHPLPSNSICSPCAPDVSYIIYGTECSNISKIAMSRLEHFLGRFTAFSTSQSQYVTSYILFRKWESYTL